MSSLLGALSSYLLNSLWLTVLVWVAGRVGSRMMRRLGPETTHRFWVAALLVAVLLPLVPAMQCLRDLTDLHGTGNSEVTARILAGDSSVSLFSWGHLLLPGWALWMTCLFFVGSTLWFGLALLRRTFRTRALVRRALPLELPAALRNVQEEMEGLFCLQARTLTTTGLPGPAVVGLRHAVLLLPAGFLQQVEVEDFRAALAHEYAHINRHDYAKNLLYECISLPLAFHPLVWLLKAQIAETRELVCDRVAVAESAPEARTYVRSLLNLALLVASASERTSLNAIGIFDANILEVRVMHLRENLVTVRGALRYSLLGASAASLLSVSLAGMVAPLFAAAEAQQGATVYHIGKDVSAPVLTRQANPEFPPAHLHKGDTFSGTCQIALVVDRQGRPQHVRVIRSLGEGFDQSAVTAVRQYRFRPAMHAGRAVPVELRVDVNFQQF